MSMWNESIRQCVEKMHPPYERKFGQERIGRDKYLMNLPIGEVPSRISFDPPHHRRF